MVTETHRVRVEESTVQADPGNGDLLKCRQTTRFPY
jgi:hypothetical protein